MDRVFVGASLLAIVLLLCGAPFALAVEEHGGGHGSESNIFLGGIELAIWTVVVFLLLLFVLGKFAWPMMLQGLEKREQAIAQAMEEARKAQAETERVRADLQQKMNNAAAEIRQMMDEARRHAQQLKDELEAKGQEKIKEERERLHREIELAKDQALKHIWTQAGQLAALVSSKAIRRQLNEDDHRRLVDEALVEMNQAAGERKRVLAGLQ